MTRDMAYSITRDAALEFQLGLMRLSDGRPTVNGTPLSAHKVESVQKTSDGTRVRYREDDFALDVKVRQLKEDCLYIDLMLYDFVPGTTWQSFGFQFASVLGIQRIMRQGFYSWDGTEFYDVHELPPKLDPVDTHIGFTPRHSHTVTALLDDSYTAVIGATETRRMLQTFLFTPRDNGRVSLDIDFHWEEASTASLDTLQADPLCVLVDKDTEAALRRWARIFAGEMGGGRVPDSPTRGWCSWYYLYYYATERDIEDNLAGAMQARDEKGIPLDIILIDANHFAQFGDWLMPNPYYYPNGQQRLIRMIQDAGFVPGLWIAPFWVANRSKLFREHPDWVVQSPDGGPLIVEKHYGEHKIWCYRVEESYVLDTTHPAALAFLIDVLRTWCQWGVRYFKTDFMFQGLIPGIRHDSTRNRLAVWRDTAEALRDAIGDSFWSGCGQPLFPSVGLVDANRISGDVGPAWSGTLSQKSILRDAINRHYMHNIFWQNDPDCILVRDFHHDLTDSEIISLALYAGMSGGLFFTSDPLSEVRSDRVDLLRFVTPRQTITPSTPLLGKPTALKVFVNSLAKGLYVVLFLNAGEVPVSAALGLEELGLPAQLYAMEWMPRRDLGLIQTITFTLAPHDSLLVYLAPYSLDRWEPTCLLCPASEPVDPRDG